MAKKELSQRMKTLIEKHGEEAAYELIRGWGVKGGKRKVPKGWAITGDAVEKSKMAAEARKKKRLERDLLHDSFSG